jgi:autotransporter-associated beta strand protein
MISNLQRDPNLTEDRFIPASLPILRAPSILRGRARFIVFTLTCLFCGQSLLMGATFTWNGGGGNVNWSTGANWVGGTAPASANNPNDLVFAGTTNPGTVGTPLNQNIATPFIFNSITFNSGGGSFFIGGNQLSITALGTSASGTITQSSSSNENISNTITNAGGGGGSNAPATLALTGNGTGVVTLSGVISTGAGARTTSLTKSGSSTFVLSGNNTYTGTTSVTGGTLLVNGNQSTATGAVTVNGSGTTLGGTGTIGGAVTLGNTTAGAVLNAGPQGSAGTSASVGTLHTGALTLTGANTFHADAFGTAANQWDQVVVSGLAALGTTSSLQLAIATAGLNFIAGTTYVLIDATTISGSFSNATEGTLITVNGYNFTAHYDTAAGDFDLIAIPEPSTWVAAALTLLAIGFTQRRKVTATLKTLPVRSSKL